MKRKGISVAALLICCIFIVTIITFISGVYSDYRSGLEAADTRFDKLSAKTAEASGTLPYNSMEFITLFNNAVGSPEIYRSVRLSVNGTDIYSFPEVPSASSSIFVKPYRANITVSNTAIINLSADIYTVTPLMIYRRARLAFILVLAGTLGAAICLLYLYLSDSRDDGVDLSKVKFNKDNIPEEYSENRISDIDVGQEQEEASESKESIDEYTNQDEMNFLNNDEQEKDDFEAQIAKDDESDIDYYAMENAYKAPAESDSEKEQSESEENEQPEISPELPEENYSVKEEASEKGESCSEEDDSEEPLPEIDAELPEEIALETSDDIPEPEKPSSSQSAKTDIFSNAEEPGSPKGLFSPESGFGWESYLKSRLESELVRSASSEQDLALMLLRIQGLDKKSPCYNAICKLLQEIFQFKDLIFEYKNDGFAIIDQNKDVDKAMETAEKLFTEIMSILNKWNSNAKTTIGISTRSLRLMSADRLETEAEQALIHADADADSPIVAFRVNPEKYRKYIAEK